MIIQSLASAGLAVPTWMGWGLGLSESDVTSWVVDLLRLAVGQLAEAFLKLGLLERLGTVAALLVIGAVGLVLMRNAIEGAFRQLILGAVLVGLAGYLVITFAPLILA